MSDLLSKVLLFVIDDLAYPQIRYPVDFAGGRGDDNLRLRTQGFDDLYG